MLPTMPVIFLWPLIVLLLFKRFDLPLALCWSIIFGYLFLPTDTSFDLPLLPAINKDSIPSLSAALIALVYAGKRHKKEPLGSTANATVILSGWLPRNSVALLLFFALVTGGLLTAFFNGDTLVYGQTRVLLGLRPYDGLSAVLSALITVLPLLLARKYLATADSHKILLFALCIAGLIYSLPVLYEIRMSPQLNKIFYGFFPHSWRQHIRGGGFRPLVFLEHGLWLGIFLSAAVLSAIASARIDGSKRKKLFYCAAIWLFVTLVLSKTFGALLITLVIAPIIILCTARGQLIGAATIAAIILLYPALRGADLVPVERVVNFAEKIDPSRARSLNFRLKNEDILLAKAKQRPVFGWGGRGRARAFNDSGDDISVTDGYWVITIGSNGWFGYLARFGLLTLPIILLTLRKRKYEVTLATSALCLVLAGNLIDLIPNATSTPLTWLMAGALWGRLELKTEPQRETETPDPERPERTPRYSRARPQGGQRSRAPVAPVKVKPGYTRFTRAKPNHGFQES